MFPSLPSSRCPSLLHSLAHSWSHLYSHKHIVSTSLRGAKTGHQQALASTMSNLSISLPVTPDIQSLQVCVPSTSGVSPEIKGWNGSDITIKTFLESAASEDNRTGRGGVKDLSSSCVETETKTWTIEGMQQSKTQTTIHPKETESRLAQLGLVVALFGVLSVVV